MSLTVKEAFFIHSKRAPLEFAIVDKVTNLLSYARFAVWTYADWDREHETEEVTYTRSGLHLDMKRYVSGDPKPFKKIINDDEVDLDRLELIFKGTKVIVVVNPTRGRPSEGVQDEMQVVRWMGSQLHRSLLCRINTKETCPGFSFLEFSDIVDLGFENAPSIDDIVTVTAAVACQILEDAIDTHAAGGPGIVGWDLVADISRSRALWDQFVRQDFESNQKVMALKKTLRRAEAVARA